MGNLLDELPDVRGHSSPLWGEYTSLPQQDIFCKSLQRWIPMLSQVEKDILAEAYLKYLSLYSLGPEALAGFVARRLERRSRSSSKPQLGFHRGWIADFERARPLQCASAFDRCRLKSKSHRRRNGFSPGFRRRAR